MEERGIPILNPVGGEATGHTLALAARQGKTMISESDTVRGCEGRLQLVLCCPQVQEQSLCVLSGQAAAQGC